MSEVNFFDPNINRKSKLVDKSLKSLNEDKIPLPSVVEISDSGTCNRACIFCPRSDPNYPDIKKFITPKLHEKICSELSELNYSGQLIYSGFNEPLLNKKISVNVAQARKYLPKSKIEIITNGDVLNLDRLKKLFDSGLSTILISVYDGYQDYLKFQQMVKDANLRDDQYVIRKRYLPPEEDFGITINNRGGEMEKATHKISALSSPYRTPCNYPAYNFFIDYTGEVLMCSHDWGKKNILGDINKQSLLEIWTSHISTISRKALIEGDRNFLPCSKCDVKGDLIGTQHAKAWKNYYKTK